jgi:hypothetical protein
MKHVVSVPWTDEERELLRQLRANGLGPVLIGRMMGRSKYSVGKQLRKLELPVPSPSEATAPTPRQPRPQPLRPGARTLPPLPSELNQ